MANKPVLYGFDGSTYVRTARMAMHMKGVDYDQVPVNVLEGEPKQPEHLARHPFGKVPVLDIDGLRLRETIAITRYVDESRDGPDLQPGDAKARARMAEQISLIGSYGYDAMVGWAGFHLFPDFCGVKTEDAKAGCQENSETLLRLLMEIRGGDAWLAGLEPSLSDLYLAPLCAYVSITPEEEGMLEIEGMKDWWARMQGLDAFKETAPDLG